MKIERISHKTYGIEDPPTVSAGFDAVFTIDGSYVKIFYATDDDYGIVDPDNVLEREMVLITLCRLIAGVSPDV